MKVKELKNYLVKEKIGWGGMGVVYIAEDRALGRLVALKFLAPYLLQDQEIMERFRAEARSQARLVHPNITMVYALQEAEDQAFLVLEYVDGETLEARLKRQGRLTAGEALAIFRPVLQAVEYAHSRGIIHRDLKPGNIGITTEGTVKVMDFGIALNIRESSRLTKTGHMLGSPHYMAPEQILGHESNQRTDIYALGITLFEMLTGRLPFDGATDYQIRVAQINEPPPSPRALGFTDIPAALEEVILKALAKDPKARFAGARDFLLALEAAAGGQYVISPPKPTLIDKSTQVFSVPSEAPSQPSPAPAPAASSTKVRYPVYLVSLAVLGAMALVAVPLFLLLSGKGDRPTQAGTSMTPPGRVAPPASPPSSAPAVGVQSQVPPPTGEKASLPDRQPIPAAPTPASPQVRASETVAGGTLPPREAEPSKGPDLRPAEPGKSPETAPPPKPVAVAALPPTAKKPETPASDSSRDANLVPMLKNKLSQGGFPQIEVSLDKNHRLTLTGRVKDSAQRTKVLQIAQSLGTTQPIADQITISQEKKKQAKKAKTKKKSSNSSGEEEAAPASRPEEPVRPLLPKFD